MARLNFTHLLFVTITYMVLGCSHSSRRTVKLVYRPYGPNMCRELCKDSQDSFFFVLEDLSCNRIPKGNLNDAVTCEADSADASLAGMSNWDICYKTYNNTETHLGPQKAPTCSRDLQLIQNTCATITTLHRACEEGRIAVVKYIMAHGIADINGPGQQGRTPVMAAVSKSHAPVFDFLVSRGCNMSAVDDNNDNVLHVACEGGNVEIVRKLVVNMNFDIEIIGNHGDTPALRTVSWGHMKLFKYLNSSGCNLKSLDKDGDNILHKSSMGGHVDIVEYIVSLNISDIESKGQYERTPVMLAAKYGHRNVFDFLVSKGCNLKVVDTGGNNILHLTSYGGKIDIVKYIVSVNIFNIDGKIKLQRTPVMMAAESGHREVFDFLVSKGCNLKVVDTGGNNILHLACHGGNMDIVKYIVSMNIVNIASRTRTQNTPVMQAVYNGHKKIFDYLVSKGGNDKLVNKNDRNILQLACLGGHVDMVKYIVSMDTFNIERKGRSRNTPVMLAAFNGHRKVFNFLVSKGCKLKDVDIHGNNILHLACAGGNVDIVKCIFSMNIFNIESKSGWRRTPVMLAVLYGRRKVFDFLVSKGGNLKNVDIYGSNILHVACDGGHADMVTHLLTLKALQGMEKAKNKRGLTPIQLAKMPVKSLVVAFLNRRNL